MGTYTTWEFYETFGGWPDDDERVPSPEAVDELRKQQKEEPDHTNEGSSNAE